MNPYPVIAGSLTASARYLFPGYQVSWHHAKIIEKLEAVKRGEIKRLCLSVPPQKGKSQISSVIFPVCVLGDEPDTRIIIVSYAAEKAESYSRESRDIARSERFQKLFPELALSKSSQSVTHWQFEGKRGYIHAVGAGGPVTGFGADLFIIDDPIKDREQANSELEREKLWDWFTSVALTRLSPDAAIVVIHTRWNEDDLIGRLLERQPEKWEYLNIPAVDEESGTVVWPERWSREAYDAVRAEMGERDWFALMQGQPYPPEGSLFRKEWFVISPRHPMGLKWFRPWDIAVTSKRTGSFTASVAIAVDDQKNVWIRDMIRGQWEWPEARRRIITQAQIEGSETTVLIEKGAYQFGKLAEDLVDNWEDIEIPIHSVRVQGLGDKENRARPLAARAEAGKVILVGTHSTPWIVDFIQIAAAFHQEAPITDPIDAASLGFGYIAKQHISKPNEANQVSPISPHAAELRRRAEQQAGSRILEAPVRIWE